MLSAATPDSPLARAGSFNRSFATRLYSALSDRPGNVLVSPASLFADLGGLWTNASGESRRQLALVLGSTGDDEAILAAFAAQRDAWADVGASTLQLSRSTFDASSSSTPTLVSDAHFRGSWERAFDPSSTREAQFILDTGARVSLPFMHARGQFEVGVGKLEGTEMRSVSLPFEAGHLTLVVALTEDESAALPGEFERGELAALISRQKHRAVSLSIPRLSLGWAPPLDVTSALSALGARGLFSNLASPSTARVVHHTRLVLDETGGACTPDPAEALHEAPPGQMFTFGARRPFLFVIFDKRNGAIALMGRVLDPRSAPREA